MKQKSKMKKIFKIPLITVGVIFIFFISLFGFKFVQMYLGGMNIITGERVNAEELNALNAVAPDVVINEEEMFKEIDLIQEVNIEEALVLTLSSGEDTVISQEGMYLVSGSYSDTMIIVEANDKDKVYLVFDEVSIINESKPVIYVKSADKVFITTTNSGNTMSVTNQFNPDGETNLDAVVFSKADLVFNGLGRLDINSDKGNGISTKDDLKITGGVYNISAEKNGLEANDSIRIYDGEIKINSDRDAMQSINENDDEKGYIYIENGSIEITAGDDAIRGNSSVTINGGKIVIDSCQEGIEATQIRINDGEISLFATDDGINATAKTAHRVVAEINGGIINVTMDKGDTDGIDSNGDFTMNGGTVNVEGGMAAFDIDGIINFNGGDVSVDGEPQTEIIIQQIGIGSIFKSK